ETPGQTETTPDPIPTPLREKHRSWGSGGQMRRNKKADPSQRLQAPTNSAGAPDNDSAKWLVRRTACELYERDPDSAGNLRTPGPALIGSAPSGMMQSNAGIGGPAAKNRSRMRTRP